MHSGIGDGVPGTIMSLVFSKDQLRRLALEWHRQNPEFTTGILLSAEIVQPHQFALLARIPGFIRTATEHGLYSKKDVVQFTGACILTNGDISSVPAVRAALDSRPVDEDSFMEKLMLRLGPGYWTYLSDKLTSSHA